MSDEKIIPTICNSHCGGACLLKVHVKDGVITRIETDDGEEPQFRACLKGRSYRQRVYAPDRLKYPLKRTGERGEGKFKRISWDEALEEVASEFKRVRNTYGPESIIYFSSAGDINAFHHYPLLHRLFCLAGGYTAVWGFISFEGGVFAEAVTYGKFIGTSNTRDDLVNSRLIIMWGWDPVNTRQGTNTCWYLAQAKEKGIKIVSIDPRFTDTTGIFADEWIPIVPGSDTAMLIAMAFVLIKDDLYDREFLKKYTIGFDKFKSYVIGEEDGVAKSPEWAEKITGVPSKKIESLARQYGSIKPAALIAGIAPGRTAYGEQYHRAAMVLSAMTGNVGIHGGSAAERSYGGQYWGGEMPWVALSKGGIRSPGNPVEKGARSRSNAVLARGRGTNSSARINVNQISDAILNGKKGGYPADYKMLYLSNTNYLNQLTEINKTVKAFEALEFIVVQEQFMTPTAKYADIVLPVNTFLERNDFAQGGATPFYGTVNKAIESLYESRSHFEIALGLAEKMGIKDFSDKTEEEWLTQIHHGLEQSVPEIPDYETLREKGIFKIKTEEPYVAFKEEIEDPDNHPFPTPSGKIEIYSQELAEINDPELPPIPKYIDAWESKNDPLSRKFPLQLITTHFKRRAHSQFENVPWLKKLMTQAISLNTVDAKSRDITDGDFVRVYNDRGEMIIKAAVTERIIPGTVEIPQGAWYAPDANGIDTGGSANILTNGRISPGGSVPTNTCLVQVEKYEG